MVKLGAAWEMLLEKQAKIFGATEPSDTLLESQVPLEQRRQAFKTYLQAKSQEAPTRYGKAMGWGGGIGAGLGAGLGLSGGAKGALLGAALGGGLGLATGYGLAASDRDEIARAKRGLGDVDSLMTMRTVKARRRQEVSKDYDRERRHRELVGAINKRGSAMSLLDKIGARVFKLVPAKIAKGKLIRGAVPKTPASLIRGRRVA